MIITLFEVPVISTMYVDFDHHILYKGQLVSGVHFNLSDRHQHSTIYWEVSATQMKIMEIKTLGVLLGLFHIIYAVHVPGIYNTTVTFDL